MTSRSLQGYYIVIVVYLDMPYIVVWDAQYSYDDMHFIPLLAKKYVEEEADIVSPCVQGYCNASSG